MMQRQRSMLILEHFSKASNTGNEIGEEGGALPEQFCYLFTDDGFSSRNNFGNIIDSAVVALLVILIFVIMSRGISLAYPST